MMRRFFLFGLLALGVLLEVAGDIYLKKWSDAGSRLFLFLGIALYAGGSIFWVWLLRYEFLSKAITLFSIMNLILAVLAGAILFQDELTTVQKIGIVLGIVSVALLEA